MGWNSHQSSRKGFTRETEFKVGHEGGSYQGSSGWGRAVDREGVAGWGNAWTPVRHSQESSWDLAGYVKQVLELHRFIQGRLSITLMRKKMNYQLGPLCVEFAHLPLSAWVFSGFLPHSRDFLYRWLACLHCPHFRSVGVWMTPWCKGTLSRVESCLCPELAGWAPTTLDPELE